MIDNIDKGRCLPSRNQLSINTHKWKVFPFDNRQVIYSRNNLKVEVLIESWK